VHFIGNPAAGRGRGRKALDALHSLLEPEDTLVISEGPGDCERLAAEATAAGQPVWRAASRTARAQLHPVKAGTLRTVEARPFYVDGEMDPLPAGETLEINVEERVLSAVAPRPEGGPQAPPGRRM
jgi:hypothetical protein